MPKKLFFVIIIFVAILAYVFFPKNLFPAATNIIFHRNSEILQTNGQTNILLLGTGGANHDGPNLSDTIMVANLNPQTDTISLISLPRDLWIDSLADGNGGKINEAYADGQSDNKNKGILLAKSVVESVIHQPIHYGFRIDFGGFVKAVDLIGGIDVDVAETLDDYHYPIDGQEDADCNHAQEEIKAFTATVSADQQLWDFFPCRYKHLHVDVGIQHMDGVTALEFVRSRHGVGNEGSDFARSRRQQRVIEAFRAKILSLGILLNPSKLIGLYNILQGSVDTDIPQEDILPFVHVFQQMKGAKIRSIAVDDGSANPDQPGLLINTTKEMSYGNVFILAPRVGDQDFSEIQSYIACALKYGNCLLAPTPGLSPMPPAPTEKPGK